jgi:hypothetical protein
MELFEACPVSGLPGSPDENRKVCKKRRNVAKMLRTKVTNRGVELDRKYDNHVCIKLRGNRGEIE